MNRRSVWAWVGVVGFLCMAMVHAKEEREPGDGRPSQGLPHDAEVIEHLATLRKVAEQITAARLKDFLYFIASDELEGRGTPSRGQDIAAMFIATNLSGWKLKPAGDNGSYFQSIPVRMTKVDRGQSHAEINGRPFSFPDDFGTGSLPPPDAAVVVSGPLVYVGHGWVIKSESIDAYQGVDVKGKIMIVSPGLRQFESRVGWRPKGRRGIDWERPESYAQKYGAIGIVEILPFQQLVHWEGDRDRRLARFGLAVEKRNIPIPRIAPSLSMIQALFSGEKHAAEEVVAHAMSRDPLPAFDLDPKKKLSFAIAVASQPVSPRNVVAMVEGSDPILKNEYLVIGAHYDHIGMWNGSANQRPPVDDDVIYNGADDNGSGTVALMALAEAFARGPRPRRSILFTWWTGEEGYELGSKHFTRFPTVPLKQIVAYLNLDMVGRTVAGSGPNELDLSSSSTMLDAISSAVNKAYLNMTWNYRDTGGSSDELDPSIPIQFYEDGDEMEDHHRASDSADKIDYTKLERVSRTVYATAWIIANTKERPRVDKPHP